MSESAVRRLSKEKAESVMEQFDAYLNSKAAVVQIEKSCKPEAGLPVHLDGQAFVAGFVASLEAAGQNPKDTLETLNSLLELSSYLRAGGAKRCLYRIETGCSISPADFFDSICAQLFFQVEDGRLKRSDELSSMTLLQKLRAVSDEDEDIVQGLQERIDQLLLCLARKLESIDQDPSL